MHACRTEFDTSHIIDKLSFGVEYPGMTNPLDLTRKPRVNPYNPEGQTGAYQYYLKVRSWRMPEQAPVLPNSCGCVHFAAAHAGTSAGRPCNCMPYEQGHRMQYPLHSAWERNCVCDGASTFWQVLKEGCGWHDGVLPCMQVVPTVYVNSHNRTILSNQYSVTEHFRASLSGSPQSQLPGVFFFYDLSPIKARKACCFGSNAGLDALLHVPQNGSPTLM